MTPMYHHAARTCSALWSGLLAGPAPARARHFQRSTPAPQRTPSFIERLETRSLMSAAVDEATPVVPLPTDTSGAVVAPVTAVAASPHVTSSNPGDGATGILRDAY